jgi:hypothetical protein
MVIEVCQSKSALALTWENFKLVFQVRPKFASAQLARALWGFLSRPTCLPPVLAGGSIHSTSNSSLQLQPNKSWSRIPVKCGRAAPQPSLANSESLRAAQQQLGRQGKERLATNLSFQGQSLAKPTWASGKFKLIMSGPVMSWGLCGISARRPTPAS